VANAKRLIHENIFRPLNQRRKKEFHRLWNSNAFSGDESDPWNVTVEIGLEIGIELMSDKIQSAERGGGIFNGIRFCMQAYQKTRWCRECLASSPGNLGSSESWPRAWEGGRSSVALIDEALEKTSPDRCGDSTYTHAFACITMSPRLKRGRRLVEKRFARNHGRVRGNCSTSQQVERKLTSAISS